MQLTLEELQKTLETHFQNLAEDRAESGYPLFAFEHGLNRSELDDIAVQLRAALKQGVQISRHWLVWVIYATEQGYGYAGDEYWRSFESETPYWEGQDRYSLARCFRRFISKYHGVEPTGSWAEHFRIIALPITHAILPKYLQRHFAKHLYELRFQLARLDDTSPKEIGRLLSKHGYHTSSRFQEFLQQEELTGRIVLGLLHVEKSATEGLIYPPTLERIVDDLEGIRNAKEWLKAARRTVADRFAGMGSRPLNRNNTGAAGRIAGNATHPELRPKLYLRYGGDAKWIVTLEVPSFRTFGSLNPDIMKFIRDTRCRLSGADDFKPRGWLLSGLQRGILKRWPDTKRALIEFEDSNRTVEHILQTECRMQEGPFWLFKIGRDGIAGEINGRIVRPGRDYIIVGQGEILEPLVDVKPCEVMCVGVSAIRIKIPSEVTTEYIQWLDRFGIQVARTIRVWPAGLPGRGWTGEGSSEWLTTEKPIIGIAHDHPIEAYELSLSDGSKLVAKAGPPGRPAFIRLPELNAGTHALLVKALRNEALGQIVTTPQAEGFMELRVREPMPWMPGTTSHSGLVVTVDPIDLDLASFWENEIDISVSGPLSHKVLFEVTLLNGSGDEIFSETVGGPVSLPVTPEVWRQQFDKFVRREECQWRYLEATAGSLSIRGEELGMYTLHFEHHVRALRWIAHHVGGNTVLRLIDDTDNEETSATCLKIAMERPVQPVELDAEAAKKGLLVEAPGTLFTAQNGDKRAVIAVSTGLAGHGLQGLNVSPSLDSVSKGETSLGNALLTAGIWSDALVAGPFAKMRRDTVVEAIGKAVIGNVTGERWIEAEDGFRANPESEALIVHLQRNIIKNPSFGAVLNLHFSKASMYSLERQEWFYGVADRFHICRNKKLCRFALDLAFFPARTFDRHKSEVNELVEELRRFPALMRGARFLYLKNWKHKNQRQGKMEGLIVDRDN